jgi:hypothetical protein
MSDKPKIIVIESVSRTRRHIVIEYTQGDETRSVKSNENPLPEFNAALDALMPLLTRIIEVEENYDINVKIYGVTMGMLRDARTLRIHAKKSLALCGKMMSLDTPPVLLSTPTTEGGVTEPISPTEALWVEAVLEEAKRYVLGERAQGTLDLDDDEDEEEYDHDPLASDNTEPLPMGDVGKPAKKKKTKSE